MTSSTEVIAIPTVSVDRAAPRGSINKLTHHTISQTKYHKHIRKRSAAHQEPILALAAGMGGEVLACHAHQTTVPMIWKSLPSIVSYFLLRLRVCRSKTLTLAANSYEDQSDLGYIHDFTCNGIHLPAFIFPFQLIMKTKLINVQQRIHILQKRLRKSPLP